MSWWKTALGIGATAGTGGWALPLLGLGASTFGSIYANKRQGNANKEALAYQERKDAEAMKFDLAQEAERKRQFDVQQAGLQRQWDAQEQDRQYDRRLLEEREARMAPRRAMAAQALQRIPGLIASGSTSPGLASLGSYRRTP